MRRWRLAIGAACAAIVLAAGTAPAQPNRPRATLKVETSEIAVAAGGLVPLVLGVSLPPDVHVQANHPDDPLLIPTVLTVDAPEGVIVESISYPQPSEFRQEGRERPLLVLGPAFEIGVRLHLGDDVPAGRRSVPIVLRYQACNETVCFPPARATSEWTLQVER